jgi:hypothetical protein
LITERIIIQKSIYCAYICSVKKSNLNFCGFEAVTFKITKLVKLFYIRWNSTLGTVIGYVGLPLARLFATRHAVVGFDINQ